MALIARSRTSSTLQLGDVWVFDLRAYDADGCPAADTITVTVYDPEEAVVELAAELVATGHYRAEYAPPETGRWVAVAGGDLGAVGFGAWVQTIVTGLQLPDITELSEYLGTHGATDADLAEALDAETAAQRSARAVPAAYPDDLRSALLRRCARHLAMKRIPLAMFSGDAEAGPAIVPGRDPEVRRLEAPYPKLVMG